MVDESYVKYQLSSIMHLEMTANEMVKSNFDCKSECHPSTVFYIVIHIKSSTRGFEINYYNMILINSMNWIQFFWYIRFHIIHLNSSRNPSDTNYNSTLKHWPFSNYSYILVNFYGFHTFISAIQWTSYWIEHESFMPKYFHKILWYAKSNKFLKHLHFKLPHLEEKCWYYISS